jgi:hypothetical protein
MSRHATSAPATRRGRRLAAIAAVTALALSACGSGEPDNTTLPDPDPNTDLVAQVASFDLAAGPDQRLLLGLFRSDRTVLGGGSVEVRVAWLGDDPAAGGEVPLSDPVNATFLPVPGNEPDVGDTPTWIDGRGAGVYQARVNLDQPGFWGARISAEIDGREHVTTTRFQVLDTHRVPTVGEAAPRVDHPTADTHDGPLSELDSRAQGSDARLPAPHLHQVNVNDALDAGTPVVLVISTPVYCASQFCGPITDRIAELALDYEDRAAFVHFEVWKDFSDNELNPHVMEWIFDPEMGGNEPWVFLIDADGTIAARWDNVLDADELESLLQSLPAA